MGRRKERRLAAKSAAGRRVKLDLSAEPTGEMDDTNVQDKAGVDLDMEKQAGVPTSPSSSGQKPHSLLLLGQYSDDEAPDSASKTVKRSGSDSPVDFSDKVPGADDRNGDRKSNDVKNDVDEGILEVDQLEAGDNQDDTRLERNTIDSSPVTCSETEPNFPVPEVSGIQPTGDFTDGWKMVLHEESNQYYYWNTQTGETSWDVPEALSNLMAPSESAPIADENTTNTSFVVEAVDIASEYADANSEIDKGPVFKESTVTPGTHHSASYSEQFCNLQGVFSDNCSLSLTESCETAHGHAQTSLLEQCENLLQRLKTLERSSNLHEWSLKITLEIEIRLSDCKALAPYGSSLLPFWSYTEQKLKDIESVMEQKISEVITTQHIKLEGHGDVSVGIDGHAATENLVVGMNKSALADIEAAETDVSEKNTEKEEKVAIESKNIQPGSSGLTSKDGESDIPLKGIAESVDFPQIFSKEELVDVDDVDMDVEMEVDDEIPANCNSCDTSCTECPIPTEPPGVQPETSLPSDQTVSSPSPSEDWIPPPPSEPFPPPPPETEPASPPPEEAAIPPPYTDTVQTYPYFEQYAIDYHAPFQYYTAASEPHGIGYYSHSDLSHVSDTQPPQYYDALAHQSYSSSASVVPIEPVAYYNGGAVPVVTVPSGTDSSAPYAESMLAGITNSVALDYNRSGNFSTKNEVLELPSQKPGIDNSLVSHETEHSNVQATSLLATSLPNLSTNQSENSSHSVSTSTSKNPSKVPRIKKRAVAVATSLRSNKKVSNLVDKWKAAKEELHGSEEDEVEDAYEILEKKRKKEIEEWRARQIATGEAQDNANFLPLGGDWRERVKRKRAESAEPVQPPSEDDRKEKKQPDLVDLSRGLPSGWQAYWDESTKEVYYGNLQTSETTWTRPSK